MGIAGWVGIKNTQLNLNLPFLLLGLGVDDAFVLAAEFARATRIGSNTMTSKYLHNRSGNLYINTLRVASLSIPSYHAPPHVFAASVVARLCQRSVPGST